MRRKRTELEDAVVAIFEQMTCKRGFTGEVIAEWDACYAMILAHPAAVAPWATATMTDLGTRITRQRGDFAESVRLIDQVMSESGALYVAADRKDFDGTDATWLRCLRAEALLLMNEQNRAAKAFSEILSTARKGDRSGANIMVTAFILESQGKLATDAIDPDLAEVVRQVFCALRRRKTAPPVHSLSDAWAVLESTRVSREE